MDIASVSSALANVNLQQQVSTAMLSKTLDLGESLSAGMVQMIDAAAMELSVNPNVGSNFDVRI